MTAGDGPTPPPPPKGVKAAVVADAQGVPLGSAVAAANVSETVLVQEALDDAPIIYEGFLRLACILSASCRL